MKRREIHMENSSKRRFYKNNLKAVIAMGHGNSLTAAQGRGRAQKCIFRRKSLFAFSLSSHSPCVAGMM